jgi:hypothetical protein
LVLSFDVQLSRAVKEGCGNETWTETHSKTVRLLGAVATIDHWARKEVLSLVTWISGRSIHLVAAAVEMLRAAYSNRLMSVAKKCKRRSDVATDPNELLEELWPTIRKAAMDWGGGEPATAASVLGLTDLVIRGVKYLATGKESAIQTLFQVCAQSRLISQAWMVSKGLWKDMVI